MLQSPVADIFKKGVLTALSKKGCPIRHRDSRKIFRKQIDIILRRDGPNKQVFFKEGGKFPDFLAFKSEK